MENIGQGYKEFGNKIIKIIIATIMVFIVTISTIMACLLVKSYKVYSIEKEPITTDRIEKALDELDVDYVINGDYNKRTVDYDFVDTLEETTYVVNDSKLLLGMYRCENIEDAEESFTKTYDVIDNHTYVDEEERERLLEILDYDKYSTKGVNYEISYFYSEKVGYGVYIVRVEDSVLTASTSDRESWEIIESLMDELGY